MPVLTSGQTPKLLSLPDHPPHRRVIVIGAGLAGLAAAVELLVARHDVHVLEARPRPGGRVLTLRDGFAEDLYAEAGATRIPDNHPWTLSYVKEFGLELVPFRESGTHDVIHIRGRRLRLPLAQLNDWPLPLTSMERAATLAVLRAKYVQPLFTEAGNIQDSNWPPEHLRAYDRMSWAEALAQRGASAAAISLLTLGSIAGGNGGRNISALQTIRAQSWRSKTQEYFMVRGGNDQLPKAMARRLADRITYGTPVVRIEQDEQQARVITRDRRQFQADYVVCAIPFTVLRHVDVTPRFSVMKRTAGRELSYDSVTKVFLQTRKRFWRDNHESGFATTDMAATETWDLGYPQRSAHGLLLSYVVGTAAQQLMKLDEKERIRSTATQVESIFPGLLSTLEGGRSFVWDHEEWSKGANSYFGIGQAFLQPHIASPEGRIHFAGDHASPWPGWMQGALQSGHRAAREINDVRHD